MNWDTLAPTALGGLLAIVGGFVGQWWGERRAVAREQRERIHEQRVWSREHQRNAYDAFTVAFRRVVEESRSHQRGSAPISIDDLLTSFDAVATFGTPQSRVAANAAKRELTLWAGGPRGLGSEDVVHQAFERFRVQVRRDLRVDDGEEAATP